jgi:hypothetical protein
MTSKGSATGIARITGLPFATHATIGGAGGLFVFDMVTTGPYFWFLNLNATNFDVYRQNLGTSGQTTEADFNNNSSFYFSLTYQAA